MYRCIPLISRLITILTWNTYGTNWKKVVEIVMFRVKFCVGDPVNVITSCNMRKRFFFPEVENSV